MTTTYQEGGGPGHGLSLDVALDAAAAEQAAVNRAAGRRTVALAQALAAARTVPATMLDVDVSRVASTTAQRRAQVAHRALVSEVACALGVSEHRARGLLADAEVLADRAPATLTALCTGSISYQHAAKVVGGVADLPPPAAAEVESAVLERAASLPPGRFGALVRTARERLHPVPAEVRREAAELKADVWLDDGKDGMSWLTAHLPTPVAHAAYDRLARTTARAKASGDVRGTGQLRAATLGALLLDDHPAAERAAAHPPVPPDPLTTLARAVRPTIHVTVPVQTLCGNGEQSGTLNGTTPLDPETARHLAARAPTLRRVLTDPVDGAMLTVDRRSYVVPADLRSFLTARDVTCRFPGCRVPTARCDIDHTVGWAVGGTTDAGNLAHLCRAHHTLKHESRWTVEQLDGGVLTWTSPRGRTYLTSPGAADHTIGQLDAWAAEASSLAAELVPATTRVGDEPSDARTDTQPGSTTSRQDTWGDPPF